MSAAKLPFCVKTSTTNCFALSNSVIQIFQLFMLQIVLAFSSFANAFYLPGVAPKDYRKEELVPLLVNALTAKDSLLPYDYYHPGFNFCKPKETISQRESLGSILFGDRLYTSEFKLPALVNQTCALLCDTTTNADSVEFIKKRYTNVYQNHGRVFV